MELSPPASPPIIIIIWGEVVAQIFTFVISVRLLTTRSRVPIAARSSRRAQCAFNSSVLLRLARSDLFRNWLRSSSIREPSAPALRVIILYRRSFRSHFTSYHYEPRQRQRRASTTTLPPRDRRLCYRRRHRDSQVAIVRKLTAVAPAPPRLPRRGVERHGISLLLASRRERETWDYDRTPLLPFQLLFRRVRRAELSRYRESSLLNTSRASSRIRAANPFYYYFARAPSLSSARASIA